MARRPSPPSGPRSGPISRTPAGFRSSSTWGIDVFQSVIDWLIAVQQPVTINRLTDGRYTVALFASTIVLRPDFPDGYVGQGYDK